MSTPERSNPAISPSVLATDRHFSKAAKPQRVLACVLCQQRKVKCDRKFPCTSCVRSHTQCVPAATQNLRQRRRRFPERELLERVRHYESLLRDSKIEFEPLHKHCLTRETKSRHTDNEGYREDSQDDEQLLASVGAEQSSSASVAVKSDTVYEAKSLWQAMNQESKAGVKIKYRTIRGPQSVSEPALTIEEQSRNPDNESCGSSPDGIREAVVKDAWKELYQNQNNDHLLFGSRKTAVDVFTLHPEQAQIFRLWQIYLDNVNSLLKVTHTSLQTRIIDAASDLANIKPTLAALMFSIYCVSVLSLGEDECLTIFGSQREPLLTRYQFGCQQALLKCEFLRSGDRDCLTALYLYLISVKPFTDPQSLSSMLGVAIRIAQRMGLHTESTYTKCPALEAEMRRRLWWSLVLFDARICELNDYKTAMLSPTWDCRTPLNLNDFDLQPEMKEPPAVQEKPSEALFAVVRSEMGEFIRHSAFHLDFVNPALKAIAKNVQGGQVPEGGELVALEKMIEHDHLKFCNSEVPLHFMTIWTARGQLAKNRLLDHYSKFPSSSVPQTNVQRDAGVSHALKVLECDTKLMSSTLTRKYIWFINFYFPMPAYIHLVQDLRIRPVSDHAEKTWEIMSENYEARFMFLKTTEENPFFKFFTKFILQAWEAHEVASRQSQKPLVPPRIVSDIKRNEAQRKKDTLGANIEQPNDVLGMNTDFSMSMPVYSGSHSLLYGMGGVGSESRAYHNMPGHAAQEFDLNDLNWTSMDWNPLYRCDWGRS